VSRQSVDDEGEITVLAYGQAVEGVLRFGVRLDYLGSFMEDLGAQVDAEEGFGGEGEGAHCAEGHRVGSGGLAGFG
jgi:hypothetical protein